MPPSADSTRQRAAAAFPGSDKKSNLRLIKLGVLMVLCLQNSIFTVLRRYSQGVLKERYSKHEVLLVGEVVKMVFSAYVISTQTDDRHPRFFRHIRLLMFSARKMFILSLIYGIMNILSYVALKNVSAGIFTICAQLKILTTAIFSNVMLNRRYSWTKWRALLTLIMGVLLFSEPVWIQDDAFAMNSSSQSSSDASGNFMLGVSAVLTEVTLSGFASIYFEKVIKTDISGQKLNIWDRNFQLALGSFPVYMAFILADGGGEAGYLGGWSSVTFCLAFLGAAGGLLVALSIKYGDSILKTLATTGAIVLSSFLDHFLLKGPMTVVMFLSGVVVVMAICDYSFDQTPPLPSPVVGIAKSDSKASLGSDEDPETEAFLNNKEERP